MVWIGGGTSCLYALCWAFLNDKIKEEVLVIEKGKSMFDRTSSGRDLTEGIFGAGGMSDHKLVFSHHSSNPIFEYVDNVEYYFSEFKKVVKHFCPDFSKVTITHPSKATEYVSGWGEKALEQSECWHIGSVMGVEMGKKMEEFLKSKNVRFEHREWRFDEEIKDKTIISLGRIGSKELNSFYKFHNIQAKSDEIHIGVRFECDFTPQIQELVKNVQYDFKFVESLNRGFLKSLRTFCVNHFTAHIAIEEVDGVMGIRKQANGHAYGMHALDKRTDKTNFAILGTFKNVDPLALLRQIEEECRGEIKEYSDHSYRALFNQFDGFGDELESFIEKLREDLKFESFKLYFPEIKIIGGKLKSMNVMDGVFVVGDCFCTRGIVPASVTAMSALDTLLR